jgi:hypothetical protein
MQLESLLKWIVEIRNGVLEVEARLREALPHTRPLKDEIQMTEGD